MIPGGGGGTAALPPPPKDEKGVKEWLRNKFKALALLLGRLGGKLLKRCLVLLERSSAGFLIELQRQRDWYQKPIGIGCRYWRINLYVYGNPVIIVRIVI